MAVICVLSHHPKLTQLVESVDYPFLDHISLRIVSTTMRSVARKALELDKSGEVDVFVCGGVNSTVCMELPLQARFASIDITGFDLLLALSKAAIHSRRAAVITYRAPCQCALQSDPPCAHKSDPPLGVIFKGAK